MGFYTEPLVRMLRRNIKLLKEIDEKKRVIEKPLRFKILAGESIGKIHVEPCVEVDGTYYNDLNYAIELAYDKLTRTRKHFWKSLNELVRDLVDYIEQDLKPSNEMKRFYDYKEKNSLRKPIQFNFRWDFVELEEFDEIIKELTDFMKSLESKFYELVNQEIINSYSREEKKKVIEHTIKEKAKQNDLLVFYKGK